MTVHSPERRESVAARLSKLWFAFGIAAAALSASTASAQVTTTCVSPAYGVPGLPGAPAWMTTGTKVVKTDIDDPRWAGATRQYFPQDLGVAALTESNVRLLKEGNILHVSFRMRADLGPSPADTFWVGVGKNATDAATSTTDDDYWLARVTLNGIAVNAAAQAAPTVSVWESQTGDLSGTGWQPQFTSQFTA
jgi:hypothetical protein